eukprot:364896-Chlamydomonas_euryale.AAC.6
MPPADDLISSSYPRPIAFESLAIAGFMNSSNSSSRPLAAAARPATARTEPASTRRGRARAPVSRLLLLHNMESATTSPIQLP